MAGREQVLLQVIHAFIAAGARFFEVPKGQRTLLVTQPCTLATFPLRLDPYMLACSARGYFTCPYCFMYRS